LDGGETIAVPTTVSPRGFSRLAVLAKDPGAISGNAEADRRRRVSAQLGDSDDERHRDEHGNKKGDADRHPKELHSCPP